MDSALRASLRLSSIAPGDVVSAAQPRQHLSKSHSSLISSDLLQSCNLAFDIAQHFAVERAALLRALIGLQSIAPVARAFQRQAQAQPPHAVAGLRLQGAAIRLRGLLV